MNSKKCEEVQEWVKILGHRHVSTLVLLVEALQREETFMAKGGTLTVIITALNYSSSALPHITLAECMIMTLNRSQ